MQTVIVILIVVVASIFLVRRFLNTLQRENRPTSGCGCDGCSPSQKDSCSDMENQS